MADLTCSVNTCASHNGGYCCRRAIEIHGPGAAMKDETFCGSFLPRAEGEATNSVSSCHPNPTMEVHCTAGRYAYNEGGRCTAENVGISGGSADVMQETLCDSFVLR